MRVISPNQSFLQNALVAGTRLSHLLAVESALILAAGTGTSVTNIVNDKAPLGPTQTVSREEGAQFGLLLTVGGALSAAASLKVSEGLNRKLNKDFPLS